MKSPDTSLARRFGWQGCLDTKGLEFDGIVVVRPQEIEDESVTGRSTLYVVLTPATQLLTTIT